jgi:hypothetical protein
MTFDVLVASLHTEKFTSTIVSLSEVQVFLFGLISIHSDSVGLKWLTLRQTDIRKTPIKPYPITLQKSLIFTTTLLGSLELYF